MDVVNIHGILKNEQGNPINKLKVQLMKSDQKWFEDHYDDIIDSKWVNDDGTFEISFSKKFNGLFEELIKDKLSVYLFIRNSYGQIIKKTETKEIDSDSNDPIYYDITLHSTDKMPSTISLDPYSSNSERILSSFERLGDVSEFHLNDTSRIFNLLNRSINAWTFYTNEYDWKTIGYDGPQVPKYPWKKSHTHKLAWEKN